jgi:aminoglycoside phosphotransferase (APT) family kinase protein
VTVVDVAPTAREVALSPEWITQVLQAQWPGARVSEVTVLWELTTLATKLRLGLEYDDQPAGAPPSIFMKAFLDDAVVRAWIGEPEARFFAELAPGLDLRMPRAVYAGIDDATRHGIVVLEDLETQGVTFLGALSPYSPEQADATLGELAKLHAQSWDAPELGDEWLQPVVSKFTEYRTMEVLQGLLDGERGDPLPDAVCNAVRLRDSVAALFAATADARRCLVHGDAHAGNLYLTAAGEPGICDWQIVSRGHWSFDVAYHTATALTPEDRRASEQDLLRAHLDRMRVAGADVPAWGDAWDSYRRALVYGYNLWAVTTTVEPRITNEFVRRQGLAVAEHGSMEMLGL